MIVLHSFRTPLFNIGMVNALLIIHGLDLGTHYAGLHYVNMDFITKLF
jgi:hypothetical protein